MLNLNHILNRFGYGRPQHPYRRPVGGGLLFSLAAMLGWRNRDRIRQFFRERFHIGSQDPMMRRP